MALLADVGSLGVETGTLLAEANVVGCSRVVPATCSDGAAPSVMATSHGVMATSHGVMATSHGVMATSHGVMATSHGAEDRIILRATVLEIDSVVADLSGC